MLSSFFNKADKSTSDGTTDNDDIHYFNNAGQAVLSSQVKQIGRHMIEEPPWISHPQSMKNEQHVRELFASLIQAEASNIAIFPSTAFAITLAATNIIRIEREQKEQSEQSTEGKKTTKKKKILILQDQYDSAIYPWQQPGGVVQDEDGGLFELAIIGHPTTEDQDLDIHDRRKTYVIIRQQQQQYYCIAIWMCLYPAITLVRRYSD